MPVGCDVFLSFKNLGADGLPTRDSQLARQLHDLLSARGITAFCSTVSLEQLGVSAYKQAIDSALDAAKILIAVGTNSENLDAPWVRYEWDSFLIDVLSGIKSGGQVFVFLDEGDIRTLPRALRQIQVVTSAEGGLERLIRFVENGLGKLAVRGHGMQPGDAQPLQRSTAPPAGFPSGGNHAASELAKLRTREAGLRADGNDQALLECIEDEIRLVNPMADAAEFLRLLREQERLFRNDGNVLGLTGALANQLRLLLRREMYDAAITVAHQLESLLRGQGSKVRLKECLGLKAESLLNVGNLQDAMTARKDEEALAAKISDEDGVANSLGGQAEIHRRLGNARKALDLLKQQETLYRSRSNFPGLGRSLFNQARLLVWDLARGDEAVSLAEKSLRLARNHGLQGLVDEIGKDLERMRAYRA